ncbi:iron-regulated protein [Hahella sp. CCB-MM4]|uniref:imelysin family protein n=1 Tax=Hahella sp. (strain CCB-MM4) TaxID=1926491 RepID=UPI000B9B2516|nr:imelysin family protein [Hahella sp. CCB-MM4]OZG74686.1 iron-regulated protein [Hahella sp. CCB-MM4]
MMPTFKLSTVKASLATVSAAALLTACAGNNAQQADQEITPVTVAEHYADMAYAEYSDSLETAKALQSRIATFLDNPTSENLAAAKEAYLQARVPYQQSEAFRFDLENGHVTPGLDEDGGPASIDDWEGQVNAWPLDEALIDYVDASSYQGEYSAPANIINSFTTLTVSGEDLDVSNLTPELLAGLNEVGGAEANVTTGIHSIEFLLWGQDTNGTNPGAGQRPVSDYYTQASQGACTSGPEQVDAKVCQRRAQYLRAVTSLLVSDLTEMANEWTPEAGATKGTLRNDFLSRGDGVQRVLDSMGDLAIGELASERMKVAILFGSTEDEHDCFSDATHIAIFNNAQGVINAYTGTYKRVDGTVVSGPSLSDLVRMKDSALDTEVRAQLDLISQHMQAIVDSANNGKHFDQLVGGSQDDKKLVLSAAEALVNLEEPLSDGVGKVLAVQVAEFDAGTCPTDNVSDCG